MTLLSLSAINKTYRLGTAEVAALRNIDLEIQLREFVAVWGPSGSGKSSLLNILGLVDAPSSGELRLDGEIVGYRDDDALARLRNRRIGIVFQSFNLITVLDALENVMLPLQIGGITGVAARERALQRLAEVGLDGHEHKRPDQMSGGQRQRVAIARALVTAPSVIIADEPTANLDSENSLHIIDLMRDLNHRDGVTFVFSTHDPRLLERVDRKIYLQDGCILNQGN